MRLSVATLAAGLDLLYFTQVTYSSLANLFLYMNQFSKLFCITPTKFKYFERVCCHHEANFWRLRKSESYVTRHQYLGNL